MLLKRISVHSLSLYFVSPNPDQRVQPKETKLKDALHRLCRASPVPQLLLDFQFTGANWSWFKAHSLLSTHSHAEWTSGSWHQRQTGSNCTAPLANGDMDNISSKVVGRLQPNFARQDVFPFHISAFLLIKLPLIK